MQINKGKVLRPDNRWVSILLTLAPVFFLCIPLGGELISLATLLCCLTYFILNPIAFKGMQLGVLGRAVLLSLVVIFLSKSVSIVWSIDPGLTYREIKKYSHFFVFIPYFYMFKLVNRPNQILIDGFLLALLVSFFMSVYAWADSGFLLSGIEFSGALKNSLVFSAIFLIMAFGVVGGVMNFKSIWIRIFAVMAVAFICLMNGKKSTILGVTLGSVYFYYFYYKSLRFDSLKKSKWIVFFLLFLFVLIFSLTVERWVLLYDQIIGYFFNGTHHGSADTRLKLFEIAFLSWWNNGFFFGQGAGTAMTVILNTAYFDTNLVRYTHYHNIIIQQLADLGLFGFLTFFGALIYLQKSIVNINPKHEVDWSFVAWKNLIIPTVVFFGLVNVYFGVNVLHLFLVYILAGVAALEE